MKRRSPAGRGRDRGELPWPVPAVVTQASRSAWSRARHGHLGGRHPGRPAGVPAEP